MATSFFNGISTFSADLQQVITRSVAIASMPITQLQNQQTTLTSQQSELKTMGSDFTALQNAFGSIDTAVTSGSLAASVGTPSVATASVSTGALPGTYSLDITSLGAQTNTISNAALPSVADPSSGNISTSPTFTLTVDNKPYLLTPTSSSLNSLVQAINASGTNVQATVVNVGSSDTPSYRLSIQGTQYAATTIQLTEGSVAASSTAPDLLGSLGLPGSPVTYSVNGQAGATSTTRALTISTGLTVTALTANTSTTITVAQNASGVQTALSALVTNFNAAVDEIAKNRGQSGGALVGQSVVSQLSNVLRNLTNYSGSGSGSIQSMTDLGLAFDTTGHLQLNSTVFNSAVSSSFSNVMSFLGSVGGNTGFLGAANQALNPLTDITTGTIVQQMSSLDKSLSDLSTKISSDQARVAQMQTSLTKQMAAADAAIASLQSQATQVTNMFAAEAQASKNITG